LSLRFWIFAICIALGLAGEALVLKAESLPEWTDEARANAIQLREYPDAVASNPDLDRQFYLQWKRDLDSVRTAKWPLFDVGSGLMTLAASCAIAILLLGIHDRSDLAALRTPRRRWQILLLAGLLWGLFWAACIAYLLVSFSRNEYPWWADSIIIPMMAATFVAVVFGPLVAAAIWFASLRHSSLPAPLWAWPARRGVLSAMAQIWWIGIAALGLFLLYDALRFEPFFFVPISIGVVYLGLVARAAAASAPVVGKGLRERSPHPP
jgi:hypothetical protein